MKKIMDKAMISCECAGQLIEKKQEMLNKIQQLERDRQEKSGRRPHNYEMM